MMGGFLLEKTVSMNTKAISDLNRSAIVVDGIAKQRSDNNIVVPDINNTKLHKPIFQVTAKRKLWIYDSPILKK